MTDLQALSPRSRALLDVGKSLLIDSITTGREFCKFLITLSTGGIPLFAVLLGFVLPKEFRPSLPEALLILLPPVLFLVAAIVATLGYFPRERELALEILDEIEAERRRIANWRKRWSIASFALFLAGVVAAVVVAGMVAYSFPARPVEPDGQQLAPTDKRATPTTAGSRIATQAWRRFGT